jgi:hypothetical protein
MFRHNSWPWFDNCGVVTPNINDKDHRLRSRSVQCYRFIYDRERHTPLLERTEIDANITRYFLSEYSENNNNHSILCFLFGHFMYLSIKIP